MTKPRDSKRFPSIVDEDRLSRRELLRWAGAAGVGGLGLGLVGCSDPPTQQIDQTPVEPTSVQSGGTFSGTVTGFFDGDVVSGATLEIEGVGTVTTDFAGEFTIRINDVGTFRVTISADGFTVRRTGLRVDGNVTANIDLMETDTDLQELFLAQFARGEGPSVGGLPPPNPGVITRWLERPRVLIYKKVDGDPETAVTDRRIDKLREVVANAFGSFTAGAFGPAPTIVEVDDVPPADRSRVPAGAICLFQTSDGSSGAGHVPSIEDPFAIAAAHAFTGTEASGGLLTRVFGQALGANPVATSFPSVMNPDGRTTFTEQDRLAARVLYGRPPGNMAPDTDPEGFFINA